VTSAAFQMDQLESINIHSDTTFALMLEAKRRGISIYSFSPNALSFVDGELKCVARKVDVRDVAGAHFTVEETATYSVKGFDFVFIRQDPPFDMAYYTNTQLLELVATDTIILNNPAGIRNTHEKLSALKFYEFMPPTLIGRDIAIMRDFAQNYADVVMKPLSLCGGSMVCKTSANDANFEAEANTLLSASAEPFIVQEFLPGVTSTDKRVMILDGEIVGFIGRKPADGNFIANVHAGGTAVTTTLTPRERQIAESVAVALKEWDIFYAGLDLIDEHLTEINVTSPTLVRELQRLTGLDVAELYWDKALARL
jgi:glutathione synthase